MTNEQNWYAPLKGKNAEAKESKARKWTPSLGLIVGLALLILIAGSSLIFAKPDDAQPLHLPEIYEDDKMPENSFDFFESFYQPVGSSSVEYRIKKAELDPKFSFKLCPKPEEELSHQSIYEKCSESIVSIKAYEEDTVGYFWGTGIILSEDGLILTNSHIIESCDSAEVELADGSVYEAKLLGADSIGDIAVLRIEATGLPAAEFGDSAEVTVGDRVVAIGNPLSEEFRATMTDGIISAIDRGVSHNGHSMTLLQTDAAINEGNSGGALFNMYGQVIGVTNMKMMSSFSSIEGIGFAIPSTTVERLATSLVRNGVVKGRPSLGITVGAIPEKAKKTYGLPDGLYITEVKESSDAFAVGIKVGDVITAVNGTPAETTNDIVKVKNTLDIGDSISFTIWREGESFDVDVMLVETNDVY